MKVPGQAQVCSASSFPRAWVPLAGLLWEALVLSEPQSLPRQVLRHGRSPPPVWGRWDPHESGSGIWERAVLRQEEQEGQQERGLSQRKSFGGWICSLGGVGVGEDAPGVPGRRAQQVHSSPPPLPASPPTPTVWVSSREKLQMESVGQPYIVCPGIWDRPLASPCGTRRCRGVCSSTYIYRATIDLLILV